MKAAASNFLSKNFHFISCAMKCWCIYAHNFEVLVISCIQHIPSLILKLDFHILLCKPRSFCMNCTEFVPFNVLADFSLNQGWLVVTNPWENTSWCASIFFFFFQTTTSKKQRKFLQIQRPDAIFILFSQACRMSKMLWLKILLMFFRGELSLQVIIMSFINESYFMHKFLSIRLWDFPFAVMAKKKRIVLIRRLTKES